MILHIKDSFDQEKDRWMIHLDGEIDVYTVGNLKEHFYQLLDERMADLEVDCSSLTYIDSTGLGALIGIRGKIAEEEKKLILLNLQPNVRKLLRITGLDKIFIVK